MKKFKHIKLFESFVNEELTPELKKRTYDAMMKIANDPNAIDSRKRMDQADNVLNSLSPAVEKLRNELKGHGSRVFDEYGLTDTTCTVDFYDYGLSKNLGEGYVNLRVGSPSDTVLGVTICKDKYEKMRSSYTTLKDKLYRDRAFVGTLKKLIVQIQNDEIPGDEPVPAQPESLTPQGSLDNVPKEDVISRYGTGGDRGNFSGLPSQDTEAGQIARGR